MPPSHVGAVQSLLANGPTLGLGALLSVGGRPVRPRRCDRSCAVRGASCGVSLRLSHGGRRIHQGGTRGHVDVRVLVLTSKPKNGSSRYRRAHLRSAGDGDLRPCRLLLELFLYRRRQARKAQGKMIDVRMFTVGPVQENLLHRPQQGDAGEALIVDPGEEADRLLQAAEALETNIEAILLTHTHFDHVGAVAPIAKATGAPVYCPELETQVLANIMDYVPWPGFGPFDSYEADETVKGERSSSLPDSPST